jgi:trk system potassium uptake protein TrkA
LQLGDDVSLIEIAPPKDIIGQTLTGLNLRQEANLTVVAIRDMLKNEVRVNPDPAIPIRDSDALIVLGKNEDIDRFTQRQ